MVKHILQLSGGKDSTATMLWLIEKEIEFEAVYCDTGFEAPETHNYIYQLAERFKFSVSFLEPKKDFFELAASKGRFPSIKARFCTTELKVVPFIDWLLVKGGDYVIYQGIRAEESNARAAMNQVDDYFSSYLVQYGRGQKRPYQYAKKRVLEWLNEGNTAIVKRPIFNLSVDEVFALHKKFNLEPNPLYSQGLSRVGCWPCIMCRHSEVKLVAIIDPKAIETIAIHEKEIGSTFFGKGYAGGRGTIWPIDKVVTYIETKNPSSDMFGPMATKCISPLINCE